MAMPILPRDFKEFLKLLNSRRVKYLLVGGYAVAFHGYPRATVDIDLWVEISPDNAEKITASLRDFGFDTPELSASLFLEENRVVRMGNPPFRIEVITTASGVDFTTCYAHRTEAVIDEIPVGIIALEDLKTNKKASGRYKDLNDLQNLP